MNTRFIPKPSDLPEGAMTRCIRDLHAMSSSSLPFEEFKKEWERKYDEDCAKRNLEHPIEYDKEFKLDKYKTVRIFKRKGEDWLCSECDMAPNGGSGSISLSQALAMIGPEKLEGFNPL